MKLDAFLFANYAESLRQTFTKMDEYMLTKDGQSELAQIKAKYGTN